MRKFNLFNFLEKKMSTAELGTIAAAKLDQLAFKELALHIGVSYIANTLSKCEIKTYAPDDEGKPVEQRDKLWYMLNVSPNVNENSSQFINKFIERYYYEGEALLVPHGDMIYCADGFDCDDSNPLKGYIYNNIAIGTRQLKSKHNASDVFHIKLDNDNVKTFIDAMFLEYGEVIDLALKTFKRTNGKKYKLLLEQYRAGDPQFNQIFNDVIKGQLEAFINNDNAVYPQFKGTDLQEFSTATPTNTNDIIAMRKEVFEVVAQALKIPLSMMYGNITNMNEIVKVYLSICIDPLADMISEEFTRKYYTYDEWKAGYRIEVDTSCINHIDIFEIADKADKAISSGLACVDELRPRVKLNPLETDFGKAHFITKNYELAERFLKNIEGGISE